jgi:hypothetical protein
LRHPRLDKDPAPPAPTVVRDVVERTLAPRPTAPEWIALLGMFAEHIADDSTALAREHWHHERLLAALRGELAQVDEQLAARPGLPPLVVHRLDQRRADITRFLTRHTEEIT